MKRLVLAALLLAGCSPLHVRATRIKGAPTYTAFYAEVTGAERVNTGDSFSCWFEALELAAPGRAISGWTDGCLVKGEKIFATYLGADRRYMGGLWDFHRVTLARERAARRR